MTASTTQTVSSVRYCLGIDGGGTKTALLLTDIDGTPLRQTTAAACNPMDIGFARAAKILREAIDDICADLNPSEIAMFAGIAGGGSSPVKEQLHDFFSIFEFAAFDNDSDNRNILEAGLGHRDGISVIIGTGICVQARYGEQLHRVGGWGYFIDRGGSGFNLGQDALQVYFAAQDGSGEVSLLSALVGETAACSPEELVGRMYSGGKTFVASFAPLVTQAYRMGDPAADAILSRNAAYIAHLIATAAKQFPEDCAVIPVVLCGGLSHIQEIVSRVEQQLSDNSALQIECLSREPVIGAAMAAQKLGKAGESSC